MKYLVLVVFLFVNTFSFADTGLEENSKPEKVNYLYSPLNHMRTQAFVGGTYFNFSGDSEADANPGFNIGVSAEVGEQLAYLVGVKYIMLKSEAELVGGSIDFQLDYLSLILGAKFYLSGTNNGFYVRGNLDPSLLINSTVKNGSSDFKDFNLFASIGLGYLFPGTTQFALDLSYNHGLMDISKAQANDTSAQGLVFNLGLLF